MTCVYSSAAYILFVRHHQPVGPVDQVEHQEGQGEEVEEDRINICHFLPPLNLIHIFYSLQCLFYRFTEFPKKTLPALFPVVGAPCSRCCI